MNKKYKLRKNDDFQHVFKRGRSTANRQFVIYRFDGNGQDSFRVGISISKKIGNAVTRNRIKRLIREAVRLKSDVICRNVDFIIIVRRPVADMKFHELSGCLYHVMEKAKLFKSSSDKKKG